MADKSLNGKVVVITGASSGFGKGAAREFARRGAPVVLAARREDLLEELALEVEAAGGMAQAVPTDVSKADQVQRLATAALTTFGKIDIWLNDAGVGVIGRFEEVPLADHVQVIETDLLGALYGSYFAMQQFRTQRFGTLINISSALGKIPAPYYSSYTAAKHGIVGLDGALRQELSENDLSDIHVCTVLPMAMDTPFFDHAGNYTGHEAEPIPPLYDPQKVIDTIIRLASDPQDEVIVGGAGKVTNVMHHVAPRLTEKFMAKQTHKTQIDKAKTAGPTEGAVHKPTPKGREVRAGRLQPCKRGT